MKIEERFQFYQAMEGMFRCPICHTEIKMCEPASVLCGKGHCFDMSREGYINFLPGQKVTKYQKQLFESRRIVFENNYYTQLAEEICCMIEEIQEDRNLCIVDAGCGEGYYDRFLQNRLENTEIYAFDIMKDAVRMGAKAEQNVRWLVGNLADIPIQSDRADLVLEIFAPSNYAEFKRILRKNGYILKVVPGKGYLKELRNCIGFQTDKEKSNRQSSEEYFCKRTKPVKHKHLLYTKSIDTAIMEHMLQMSPLMFGRDSSEVDVSGVKSLTFEFILLLGIC